MEDTIRDLLQLIRSDSLDRDKAVFQLLESDPKNIQTAMTFLLDEDEKERRTIITPLVNQVTSGADQGRGESVLNLLLLDRFSIPFLEEASLLHPSNPILSKIKEEIDGLEKVFELVTVTMVASVPIDASLHLTDKLIRATEPIYVYDSIDNNNKKLVSLVEMNVDAWRHAREELFRIGQSVIYPLSQSLKNSSRHIQRLALRSLLTFDVPDLLITVTKLLNENDVFVRDEAAIAVAQLCGREQSN